MSFFANESVSSKPYCVYRLRNATKKEIYHGIATDFDERYERHRAGDVEATSSWDFARDTIKTLIVLKGLKESTASKLAHFLEKNPYGSFTKYVYIKTKGL